MPRRRPRSGSLPRLPRCVARVTSGMQWSSRRPTTSNTWPIPRWWRGHAQQIFDGLWGEAPDVSHKLVHSPDDVRCKRGRRSNWRLPIGVFASRQQGLLARGRPMAIFMMDQFYVLIARVPLWRKDGSAEFLAHADFPRKGWEEVTNRRQRQSGHLLPIKSLSERLKESPRRLASCDHTISRLSMLERHQEKRRHAKPPKKCGRAWCLWRPLSGRSVPSPEKRSLLCSFSNRKPRRCLVKHTWRTDTWKMASFQSWVLVLGPSYAKGAESIIDEFQQGKPGRSSDGIPEFSHISCWVHSNSDDVIFDNSNNVFVKSEAHIKMVIVDVDAVMAENQKRPGTFFQWLGSSGCMGLTSAVVIIRGFDAHSCTGFSLLGLDFCFLFVFTFCRLHDIGLFDSSWVHFCVDFTRGEARMGIVVSGPRSQWKVISGLLRQLVADVRANKQTHEQTHKRTHGHT